MDPACCQDANQVPCGHIMICHGNSAILTGGRHDDIVSDAIYANPVKPSTYNEIIDPDARAKVLPWL